MKILTILDFSVEEGNLWLWEHLSKTERDECKFDFVFINKKKRLKHKIFRNYLPHLYAGVKAYFKQKEYDAVVAWEEKNIIVLSFLNKITFRKKKIIILAYSSKLNLHPKILKWIFYDHIIQVFAKFQLKELKKHGFKMSNVKFAFHPCYKEFLKFREKKNNASDFVLAFGSSARDYRNLIESFRNVAIKLKILVAEIKIRIDSKKYPNVELLAWQWDRRAVKTLRYNILHSKFVALALKKNKSLAGISGIVDSFSLGKTVIATETPCTKEYIANEKTGILVKPGDPNALRKAIRNLYNNPKKINKLEKNALKFAKDNFEMEKYVREVYDYLIS